MEIKGADLRRVKQGLQSLLGEIENQIVACPDPEHYAEALEAYRKEALRVRGTIQKVLKGIEFERWEARVKRSLGNREVK